jgi:hypothetical protein
MTAVIYMKSAAQSELRARCQTYMGGWLRQVMPGDAMRNTIIIMLPIKHSINAIGPAPLRSGRKSHA